MQSGNYDQISQKPLQTKHQNDRFFTRPAPVLSKLEANSAANSSFRVYYGGASGAIPFRWESRPGTPKHNYSETSIPPLTPPPSYYSSSHSNSKASSKPTLLSSIFPRLAPRTSRNSPSSFSSASLSSSFSSSSSSRSSPKLTFFKRRRSISDTPSLPFEYSFDDGDGDEPGSSNSPTSTLCFGGGGGGASSRASFRGCYQLVSVKNAFLSMVGHGSAGRGTLN